MTTYLLCWFLICKLDYYLLPSYQLRTESTYVGSCWDQTYFFTRAQLAKNCREISSLYLQES